MPIYIIQNKETQESYEEYFTSYEEFQEFLAEHPDSVQGVPDKLNLISGHSIKPDDSFRDLLKTIKKSTKGDNINDF